MISKPWREGLVYVAISAFLVWHTLALVVAPAPDTSVIAASLRRVLHPYLTLLKLDNKWDFYAPNAGRGHQLRYVVEDADGIRHSFRPTDDLSRIYPSEWWFRSLYDWIADSPGIYGDAGVAMLCRKHAALRPVAVAVTDLEQKNFWPDDQLNGKHPLDPEFVIEKDLGRFACPEK